MQVAPMSSGPGPATRPARIAPPWPCLPLPSLPAATEVEAALFAHPAVHQAAVFGLPSRVMGELVGAAVTLRAEAQQASVGGAGEKGGTPVSARRSCRQLTARRKQYTSKHPRCPARQVFTCMLRCCSSLLPPLMQAVTSRDLIDWCAARLAHYKVPAAVHILPRMPTTGSGKILKTELRRMFAGGAGGDAAAAGAGAATAGVSGAAPALQAQQLSVSLAEASAVVAAACSGGVTCQALDDGLGQEWGRELLPDLSYLLVVPAAADIKSQASDRSIAMSATRHTVLLTAQVNCAHRSPDKQGDVAWAQNACACCATYTARRPQVQLPTHTACPSDTQLDLAVGGKGLRNVAVLCLEQPSPEQLASLAGPQGTGARLMVLHVEPSACAATAALSGAASGPLRLALAAVREMLPPIGGVLHAPASAEDAAAASAAVAAAQAAAAALPSSPAPVAPSPSLAVAAPHKSPVDAAAMRRAIRGALGSLLGKATAAAIGSEEPLMYAGVTSTLAVQLTQQLEESLGAELPGTLVFDYPSITEMATFLAEELAGPAPAALAAPATAAAPPPAVLPPRAPAPSAVGARVPAPAGTVQQEAAAAALVLQQVSQLLGEGAAGVAPDAPLMSAGVTSTLAVQLTQLLEEAVGVELPGTLVFDYPTGARQQDREPATAG